MAAMGEDFTTQKSCLIILFWILFPTLDQYTDLAMVYRLLNGPDQDTTITSFIYFPKKEGFNGSIGEQPENIRMVYSKV